MQTLSQAQQQELFKALYFLKMPELKQACLLLGLAPTGLKGQRIDRIKQFITTGSVLALPEIPLISRAQPRTEYPLHPETKILFGSFKNDLRTRLFMQQLVGLDFHYTAFGMDWIKACWLSGQPPTYAMFAVYWRAEYAGRKGRKPVPKQEWALLNFLQEHGHTPAARSAWKLEQARQATRAFELIQLLRAV